MNLDRIQIQTAIEIEDISDGCIRIINRAEILEVFEDPITYKVTINLKSGGQYILCDDDDHYNLLISSIYDTWRARIKTQTYCNKIHFKDCRVEILSKKHLSVTLALPNDELAGITGHLFLFYDAIHGIQIDRSCTQPDAYHLGILTGSMGITHLLQDETLEKCQSLERELLTCMAIGKNFERDFSNAGDELP